MKKYIVREGDTMWTISKMTGVRLNLLVAANPQISDPNHLRPGSVVVIPELHKGNTHGMTEPSPVKASGMKGPDTQVPMPTGPSQAPSQPMTPYFGYVWPHVVKQNQSWESIAQQYKVNVSHLKQMNPVHADSALKEGDILYIPGLQEPGMTPAGVTPGAPMPAAGMEVQPQPTDAMADMPAVQPYHEGPHTHHPFRAPSTRSPYVMAHRYHAPDIPPGMWAFVPAPDPYGRYGYVPGYVTLPYFQVPATWYRDMDDSSSWDGSWSSSALHGGAESGPMGDASGPQWFGESRHDHRKD